jgi:hypothetical protein
MEAILIEVILPLGGMAITTWLVWASLRAERRRRLAADLPVSSTKGVFIGMVALVGTAESGAPLRSRVAEERCVTYSWSIEERWTRQVVEVRTDEKGREQRTTRTESGWITVASGGEKIPFYLVDADGSIRIRPNGADLHTKPFANVTCGPMNPLYHLGPNVPVLDSDGIRRISEDGIPLHAKIRVIGYARERTDMVAPEIAEHDTQELYLISMRSPRGITVGYGAATIGYASMALLIAPGTFWAREGLLGERTPFLDHLVAIGPWLAGVLIAGLSVTAFNSLRGLAQKVRRGRANVDVQLKRRNDLTPNLVKVVEGFAAQEREIHTDVATLRAAAIAANDPGPLRPTLVALSERYPTLRADAVFTELQRTLSDTEERIALARAYHHDIATAYNTRLRIFPDAIIGRLGGLRPEALFELAEYERAVEPVEFVE